MTRRIAFPSLKCAMGDWIYYVAAMSFADVSDWIKPTKEIYDSDKLADWIQRQLDAHHAARIAKYLRSESERLFNALVVGVYGAEPEWSELRVRDPQERLSAADEDHLKRTLGILTFQGTENLFAIDGQHRVAGIKRAIQETPGLSTEEVVVILVAHVDSPKGRKRTRRVFTTLNKKAKKVTKADIVALDEDNGFAVVARRLVDEFPLLRERDLVAFEGTANIRSGDMASLTSVIGLYEIATDLYSGATGSHPSKSAFQNTRPEAGPLNLHFEVNTEFWTLLSKRVPEYQEVFRITKPLAPGEFRQPRKNHLLFRPVGQRAFASALRIIVERKAVRSMSAGIDRLLELDLWLHHDSWHHVLWDPLRDKMLAANRGIAETHLLQELGEPARSREMEERYSELIRRRDAGELGAPLTRRQPRRRTKKR